MKIDQYCQRQRCKHVELEQFWHAFASRGFVSDSWVFLYLLQEIKNINSNFITAHYLVSSNKKNTTNKAYLCSPMMTLQINKTDVHTN